jgi:hypothetical protein
VNQRDRAARYSDLFGAAETAEPESNCEYCPICTTIGAIRRTKPEVLDHLATAVREVVLAAGLLLEEAERRMASGNQAGDDHPESAPVRPINPG